MKICILILTYKRNADLSRVLGQVNAHRSVYAGENIYSIWVTDSDPLNPERQSIERDCDRRIINPGVGFDDNILNYFENHSQEFDFTLTISDDDLFSLCPINPLYIIDAAVKSQKGVILFNHSDHTTLDDSRVSIGEKQYSENMLALDSSVAERFFLPYLPRHVGIVYSKRSIQCCLSALARFRNTNHLYAVPLLMAAKAHDFLFFDYPLFSFSTDTRAGGAWGNDLRVFEGLINFLIELRPLVSVEEYNIAKDGFLKNYLGKEAVLRVHIEFLGVQLPTPEQVIGLL